MLTGRDYQEQLLERTIGEAVRGAERQFDAIRQSRTGITPTNMIQNGTFVDDDFVEYWVFGDTFGTLPFGP